MAESEKAELAWICDLDADRLEKMSRRHPAARATPEVADLLADPDLDAVVIATPIDSHHELARRSLLAGKHTMVEKPLAPTWEQAEELIGLAAEVDRHLACGHTFLHSPPVRAVEKMIAQGELGEVFFISSSRVNLGLHQRDVSVIWDLAPHDFSILLAWLRESPVSIRADGRASIVPGVPDVAFVTMRYASGLIVHVELSWLAPSKLRRTVVVGSKRMVVYEDGAPEPIRIFDHGVVYKDPETFGEYHLSYRTGDITSPKLTTEEPLVLQFDSFLQRCRDGVAVAPETMLAGEVVRLLEAADRSLSEGGSEVLLAARPAEMAK